MKCFCFALVCFQTFLFGKVHQAERVKAIEIISNFYDSFEEAIQDASISKKQTKNAERVQLAFSPASLFLALPVDKDMIAKTRKAHIESLSLLFEQDPKKPSGELIDGQLGKLLVKTEKSVEHSSSAHMVLSLPDIRRLSDKPNQPDVIQKGARYEIRLIQDANGLTKIRLLNAENLMLRSHEQWHVKLRQQANSNNQKFIELTKIEIEELCKMISEQLFLARKNALERTKKFSIEVAMLEEFQESIMIRRSLMPFKDFVAYASDLSQLLGGRYSRGEILKGLQELKLTNVISIEMKTTFRRYVVPSAILAGAYFLFFSDTALSKGFKKHSEYVFLQTIHSNCYFPGDDPNVGCVSRVLRSKKEEEIPTSILQTYANKVKQRS